MNEITKRFSNVTKLHFVACTHSCHNNGRERKEKKKVATICAKRRSAIVDVCFHVFVCLERLLGYDSFVVSPPVSASAC